MAIFFQVLGAIFIAEMGDKTQLILVAMASKYKVWQILLGTALATVVLNIFACAVGGLLGNYLPMQVIKTVAFIAFFWFAYSALFGNEKDEEEKDGKRKFGAVAAVFITFFLGELGDKTQIAGITMAANYAGGGFMTLVFVFFGCTVGLILADLIGLVVGYILKSKMPRRALSVVSFVIFAIFGTYTAYEAFGYMTDKTAYIIGGASVVSVIFALICVISFIIKKKKQNENTKSV